MPIALPSRIMRGHSAAVCAGSRRARRPARTSTLAAVAWLCLSPPALAQSAHDVPAGPAVRDTEAGSMSMAELARRLVLLEDEVRLLRAQLAAAQAAAGAPAAPEDLPVPDQHDADLDSHKGWSSPSAQIHWFSDVGLVASSRPGATSSFALGQLDLFLTSQLTDQLSVLSEIVFRAGSDNRMSVNPERLLFQYAPGDGLQLSLGRFHSAVGYYNVAYHHGSWFETAATRPSIFAGGLIPIHNVGVSATGALPSGPLGLRYVAEFGNGQTSRSSSLEPTQNVVDENNRKAVNVGLLARPAALHGLQAGFSWYHDRLAPAGAPRVSHHVLAAHVVYTGGRTEMLNELVAIRNRPDGSGRTDVSYGWYSQLAQRVGSSRPYFRYQFVEGDPADRVFGALGRRHGPVIGLRQELGRFAALKLQYERVLRRNMDDHHEGAIKLAFTF